MNPSTGLLTRHTMETALAFALLWALLSALAPGSGAALALLLASPLLLAWAIVRLVGAWRAGWFTGFLLRHLRTGAQLLLAALLVRGLTTPFSWLVAHSPLADSLAQSGIAGGVMAGLLIGGLLATLGAGIGTGLFLTLSWLYWRWRERAHSTFPVSLHRDATTLPGLAVLAVLVRVTLSGLLLTSPALPRAGEVPPTATTAPVTLNEVRFPDGRRGLFTRLPESLARPALEGLATLHLIACDTSGRDCRPVTNDTRGLVLPEENGLWVATPERLAPLPPGHLPRFELRPIPGRSGAPRHAEAPVHIRTVEPVLRPDVRLVTEPEAGLDIRIETNTPIRLERLGLWLLPAEDSGPLFDVPRTHGHSEIAGMAVEIQPPLRPRLPDAAKSAGWQLGSLHFFYPLPPDLAVDLLHNGDRRHGRRIPLRLHLQGEVFGRQPGKLSHEDLQAVLALPAPGGSGP